MHAIGTIIPFSLYAFAKEKGLKWNAILIQRLVELKRDYDVYEDVEVLRAEKIASARRYADIHAECVALREQVQKLSGIKRKEKQK